MHLQIEFGFLFGLKEAEKVVPQSGHNFMAKKREESISRIKAVCEAFNRTYGKELGQNAEQFCRDHYTPLSDFLEQLKPESDKVRPDKNCLDACEKVYWEIMATQEEIPGQGTGTHH